MRGNMKLAVWLDEPLTFMKIMDFESIPELDSKLTIDGEAYFVHRRNPREISLRRGKK